MTFQPFTFPHWAAILFTAAAAAGIIGFRQQLRGPRGDKLARRVMAVFLVASEISLYTWYTLTDRWGYFALPFQLCTVMIWLSAAMLWTRSRRLYDFVFFLGILGALQAILTPYLQEPFPHFRYFHFFLAHAAIIAACVYMTAAAGYRPNLRSVFRAWLWLNLLAIPAGIANALTGENFMFLARKPDTASLLDTLAPWPWYIPELEAVAVLLCLMLLGIVTLADRLFGNRQISDRKQAL